MCNLCQAEKPTREAALMYYRGVVRNEEIRVRTFTKLLTATPSYHGIRCELEPDVTRSQPSVHTRTRSGGKRWALTADRLVLASGHYDNPNRLTVPGEDSAHVSHYFDGAHASNGLNVVVVGGKNSAIEAALQLFRAGDCNRVH